MPFVLGIKLKKAASFESSLFLEKEKKMKKLIVLFVNIL